MQVTTVGLDLGLDNIVDADSDGDGLPDGKDPEPHTIEKRSSEKKEEGGARQ